MTAGHKEKFVLKFCHAPLVLSYSLLFICSFIRSPWLSFSRQRTGEEDEEEEKLAEKVHGNGNKKIWSKECYYRDAMVATYRPVFLSLNPFHSRSCHQGILSIPPANFSDLQISFYYSK